MMLRLLVLVLMLVIWASAQQPPYSPGVCTTYGNRFGICQTFRLLDNQWVTTDKFDCNPVMSGSTCRCRCITYGPRANCITYTDGIKHCYCTPDNALMGILRQNLWCCRGYESGGCPDSIIPRWACCPPMEDKCLMELDLNGDVRDCSGRCDPNRVGGWQRGCEYATFSEMGLVCPVNVTLDKFVSEWNQGVLNGSYLQSAVTSGATGLALVLPLLSLIVMFL